MSRLTLLALASALVPAAAAGQTVSPPVPWEDTPQVRLNVPVAAAAVPPPAPVYAPPAPVAVRASATAVRPTPFAAPVRPAAAPVAIAPQHRRLQRGHSVGAFWRTPRVEVRNYDSYGLYPPAGDDRWVRYYDDALLIDGGGIVRDSRYGLDWDQYADAWTEDGGIPVYVGAGDYYPGRDDYAHVEGYDDYAGADDFEPEDERYADHAYRGRRGGEEARGYSCQVVHGDGPPMPCEAGYRPAWTHDYPPGTVITETIVTTSHGLRKAKAHAEPRRMVVRKRALERRPAPPPYGERG